MSTKRPETVEMKLTISLDKMLLLSRDSSGLSAAIIASFVTSLASGNLLEVEPKSKLDREGAMNNARCSFSGTVACCSGLGVAATGTGGCMLTGSDGALMPLLDWPSVVDVHRHSRT
jgi:hypothetical protein